VAGAAGLADAVEKARLRRTGGPGLAHGKGEPMTFERVWRWSSRS